MHKSILKHTMKRHSMAFVLIAICCTIGIIYISHSARDIVFMDYWRMVVELTPPLMEKSTIPFELLWKPYLGQRNPLLRLLLAFDIVALNLNCVWEEFAGMIVIGFSAISVYFIWNRLLLHSENKHSWKTTLLFILPLLSLFNFNQWEILSLQFSLAFMIRIFTYLTIFNLLDRSIIYGRWNKKHFFLIGILIGFSICFLSQLYFPAMLLAIGFTLGLAYPITPENRREKCIACSFMILPCIFGVAFYLWGIEGVSNGNSLQFVIDRFLNGDYFKGMLYMITGSLIPQTITQHMTSTQIIIVGMALLGAILFAIILFFRLHIYKHSFFPALALGYGLMSIPIIVYGRIQMLDLFYLTSSRYTCETTLIWLGCGLIFGYAMLCSVRVKRLVIAFIFFALTFAILHADLVEFRISSARGQYKDSLLEIMQTTDPNQIPDETLTLFQAPIETVRSGIEILKHYKLNVFK